MSKDIDLTNSLFSAVHFESLDGWAKVFKTFIFWFINVGPKAHHSSFNDN